MVRVYVWEARQAAGLTLQQLEHKTGISRSTLNRIENGQIVPRLDQLEARSEERRVGKECVSKC